MRRGAVSLPAVNIDNESIDGREGRTDGIAELADFHLRERMEAKDRLGSGIVEHPLFIHQRGATLLTRRCALFGGLKDQLDRARQLVADGRQDRGNAELTLGSLMKTPDDLETATTALESGELLVDSA